MIEFLLSHVITYVIGVLVLAGVIIYDRKEAFKNIKGKRFKLLLVFAFTVFWPLVGLFLVTFVVGSLLCMVIEQWFVNWLNRWEAPSGFN